MCYSCSNCEAVLIVELECVTDVVAYNGENYCSEDCRDEHNDLGECAYCGQTGEKEYTDESYEDHGCGYTCNDDCHSEAVYLYKVNGGDANREHRTY